MNDPININATITQAPVPAKAWWKRKRFIIPGAILALFILGSAIGGGNDKPTKPLAGNPVSVKTADAPAPPADVAPPVTYDTPKISDFQVKVKVTSKHCFGSAGCNVEVKTTLAVGSVNLDPSIAYELTYELSGDEDGPVVETMRVQGDQYTGGKTSLISTPASGTKISARITSVEQE